MTNLSSLLTRLSHLVKFLGREGSWALLPHEQSVLNAGLAYLDESPRELSQRQLEQSWFMDRMTNGHINVFRFYEPDTALIIAEPAFADKYIRVNGVVNGKRQKALLSYYKGYIYSIEFKKPTKFYVGKEFKVVSVEDADPKETYTRVIDRATHGREPN